MQFRDDFFVAVALQAIACLRRLVLEVSRPHTHTYAYSVGLLRTSNHLVAETTDYTTKETNIHALGGIRTRNPCNRNVADLTTIRIGVSPSPCVVSCNTEECNWTSFKDADSSTDYKNKMAGFRSKQERQCTCNLIQRRGNVVVEK
jgi:hypothetical protein